VVYAVTDDDQVILVEAWVPAAHVSRQDRGAASAGDWLLG